MSQTISDMEETPGSARSLFDATADLVTAKGVVLLVFLAGITVASIAVGEAIEGVLPGAALAVLLVCAVAYEDVRNETIDVVGVVAVVLATVYTGLEYIGIRRQGLWFPLVAAFLLLATSAFVAWRAETEHAAEFVEKLDVVGLHGGILFILYSLLYLAVSTTEASTNELLFSPVIPAVVLFFALSLLGTTVAYAARSSTVDVASDELHHKLVSVVRGLAELDDTEERESLGQHVRSVAQALSGVQLPSSVGVSDGRVPVVLPVSGEPAFEAEDIDELLKATGESGLTGYAVSDGGSAILFKNGKTAVYYIAPKDHFGTNPDVLPYGYFGDSRVYASPYSFVDAVEDVLTKEDTRGKPEETLEEQVGTSKDGQEKADTGLSSGEEPSVPDEDEIAAEAEEIAEEKGIEEAFSETEEKEKAVAAEGEKDRNEGEKDEVEKEKDEETEEAKEDSSEEKPETTFEEETDISKKLDDTGDLFD